MTWNRRPVNLGAQKTHKAWWILHNLQEHKYWNHSCLTIKHEANEFKQPTIPLENEDNGGWLTRWLTPATLPHHPPPFTHTHKHRPQLTATKKTTNRPTWYGREEEQLLICMWRSKAKGEKCGGMTQAIFIYVTTSTNPTTLEDDLCIIWYIGYTWRKRHVRGNNFCKRLVKCLLQDEHLSTTENSKR